MHTRRNLVWTFLVSTAILATFPLELAGAQTGRPSPASTRTNQETSKSESGSRPKQAEPAAEGDTSRNTGLLRRNRAKDLPEPGVDRDDQAVIGMPPAAAPTVHIDIVIDSNGVSSWQADAEGDEGISGSIEGNLAEIAKIALETGIFEEAPNTRLLRGAAGVPTEAHRLKLRILDFKEFRDSAGNYVLVSNAELAIFPPGNLPHQVFKTSFPPGKHLSDEELRRRITAATIGLALTDAAIQGVEESVKDDVKPWVRAAREFFVGTTSGLRARADYALAPMPDKVTKAQMQEALVRIVVADLVQQAIDESALPGSPERVRFGYKNVSRRKTDEVLGWSSLQAKDYKGAIRRWSEVPNPSLEVRYNLGVLHMKLAASTMANDVDRATAHLLSAKSLFEDPELHIKYQKQRTGIFQRESAALLYEAPGRILARLERESVGWKSPPAPRPTKDRWALLIGVGKFAHTDDFQPLPGPRNDVASVAKALGALGFSKSKIITLQDEKATQKGIREALGQLHRETNRDSLVLVYIATHGLPGRNNDGFIACYDTAVDRPFETGWLMSELRSQVALLPAEQRVFVQDTCHSGTGPTPNFPSVPPLMAIIAASQANQLAGEHNARGIMTQPFVQSLQSRQGKRPLAEIADEVHKKVVDTAKDLGKIQEPKVSFGLNAGNIQLNH